MAMVLKVKGFLAFLGSRNMALTVLASITGLYYLLVAVNNCVDPDTNRRGVAAILSMRDTIHHAGIDWHAISNGKVVWIVYVLIVIWEYLIASVLIAAAVMWWRVEAGRPVRDTAVQLASLGWTMAIVQFLGGFLTVAGEWFRMWANKEVDASPAALQNFLIAAVGLILAHLPDQSAESRSSSASWLEK
jgi:predicted small integral membrane protein